MERLVKEIAPMCQTVFMGTGTCVGQMAVVHTLASTVEEGQREGYGNVPDAGVDYNRGACGSFCRTGLTDLCRTAL